MENIIEISGLYKNFKSVKAVDGLSFKVKRGELFAFLGVNGAGKSTTINIMCGQLLKDAGSIIIDGFDLDKDIEKIKREIGVVFQNSVLDSALSVYDNLQSRAALYGITGDRFHERLSQLAELLDFKSLLKRTVGKLSGGQRRRIDVARALLHKPEILILDEPTTGLDPQTRRMLWYVIILDGGRISAEGTPLMLKNKYTGDYITLYGADESTVASLGVRYERVNAAYRLFVSDTKSATELIVKNPTVFGDYEVTKGKMDDVFLAVTGKRLGEVKNEYGIISR